MTHRSQAFMAAIHARPLISAVLVYVLPLLSLTIFGVSLYGKMASGALADCATLYAPPGWENGCANWRAAFSDVGLTPFAFESYFLILRLAAALPFFALAVVLVRRRGGELRVLLLSSLLVLLGIAGPIYNPFWQWAQGWYTVENQVPALTMLVGALDFTLSVGAVFFALLFPDGRFVPGWTRWIAGVWVLIRFGDVFLPDTPASVSSWPYSLGVVLQTVVTCAAIGAMIWRYRARATAVQRQQMKWITAGGLLLALNYALDYAVWEIHPAITGSFLIATEQQGILWELGQDTFWYLSQIVFAVCVGLAVFRYRLWDIDIILSRALVYGGLTALVITLYVVIVGGLGALVGTPTNPAMGLVATALIAVIFQPLRDRLQRGVTRLLYGDRDDPALVLSRLAHHLETEDTSAILPTLARTIAGALKAPHVGIWRYSNASAPEPIAVWGERSAGESVIPLVYQKETVGQLTIAPRGPDESFNRHEQDLLSTIAALTATTVHAVELSDALQHSRERIIAGREEERRRLRRDLHDGLGPALASLPLKIDAAVDLLDRDRQSSEQLLGSVKLQAQQLVADVRRVVHDLRPPALDELGLTEALRGALAQLGAHPQGLQIALDAGDLPHALPAAVEVAAYRICMEAATNVVKHARAEHCWVVLRAQDAPAELHITVDDDGIGIPQAVTANVGLRSMRERAEELGGTLHFQRRPAGGTRVAVTLPLTKAP